MAQRSSELKMMAKAHTAVQLTFIGNNLGELTKLKRYLIQDSQSVAHRGGEGSTPPPEIPKALQNRAKLNPIVKTVKNC